MFFPSVPLTLTVAQNYMSSVQRSVFLWHKYTHTHTHTHTHTQTTLTSGRRFDLNTLINSLRNTELVQTSHTHTHTHTHTHAFKETHREKKAAV